ncbi:MAG: DUF348 domain-containing protein [Ruminococcaceae bacterium]|nr:DUF348 domain-containing protein [Oscillospiraceae bacterium]
MIEKIKYRLSQLITDKHMRLRALSMLTALTIAVVTLLHTSIHTIEVFDGERTYVVTSLSRNVASVMSKMKFKSDKYAILNTNIFYGTTSVQITYGFPVYITQGDKTTKIEFFGGTVADALKQAGFTVDEHDFVEPALDTQITATQYIDYTDIGYTSGTYTEAIPFDTKTEYTSALNKGVSKVTKPGVKGSQLVNYTQKTVNGVPTLKEIVSTTVLSQPINAVQLMGTKPIPANPKNWVSTIVPKNEIALDANGVPIKYKSKMTVRATAYTHTGNRTATGVWPKPGHIAVNPKIIPYGTKMFIKTVDGKYIYGYAVAADTGGFIKKHPTGIDLFMDTERQCINFGVRKAEIYILE